MAHSSPHRAATAAAMLESMYVYAVPTLQLPGTFASADPSLRESRRRQPLPSLACKHRTVAKEVIVLL